MKSDSVQNLMPPELIMLTRFCRAALIILNARLFTLLATMLAAAMFGWVLWQPDWIRFAGACAFAVLVFWPLQRMEARRIAGEQAQPKGDVDA